MDITANIFVYFLEDDKDYHAEIEALLKANGITHYRIFDHPKEFLDSMTADLNICVIDHYLPGGMDGLDVVREVKSKNAESYIIVMTGQKDYKVVVKYITEGADDYIDKNEDNYRKELIVKLKKGLVETKRRATLVKILEHKIAE